MNSEGPRGLLGLLTRHLTNTRIISEVSLTTVPTLETMRAEVSIRASAVPFEGWGKLGVEEVGGKPDLPLSLDPAPRGGYGPA